EEIHSLIVDRILRPGLPFGTRTTISRVPENHVVPFFGFRFDEIDDGLTVWFAIGPIYKSEQEIISTHRPDTIVQAGLRIPHPGILPGLEYGHIQSRAGRSKKPGPVDLVEDNSGFLMTMVQFVYILQTRKIHRFIIHDHIDQAVFLKLSKMRLVPSAKIRNVNE